MKSKIIQYSSIKLSGLAAASILFLAANHANAAPGYIFHDLGTTTGGSAAVAINNAGQIVGTAAMHDYILAVWNGTTMKTGDAYSIGFDINSVGQIAGGISSSGGGEFHAATWDSATLTRTDLDDFSDNRASDKSSDALGINDAGQMVGMALTADGIATKPILWNNEPALTVLDTLGGVTGEAWGINNAGFAVGSSFTSGDTVSHATRWDVNNGTVTDLGTFADNATDSAALAINTAGQIVGWSNTAGNLAEHAAFWDGAAAPVDLGTLGGTYSRAWALNNDGDIVGRSDLADGTMHATFWDGTAAVDLNSLLDPAIAAAGWVLVEAKGINDHGAIVGYASNDSLGIESRAYLLSPVPEPETYAMLLAGLGLMGAIARRRKTA